MKARETISVIIPNYNNAKYLESCLNSVLSQDHADIEIILMDDCSTDGSQEIIGRYTAHDKRIIPHFNKINLGVAVNRHKGIQLSQGRYITTLDSDDIFLRPDKLSREYEVLASRKIAGSDNGIAFSGIVLLDADGNSLGRQNAHIRQGYILNEIVRRSCLIPRDFLFTREQYSSAGGFDTRIPIYEDWDLKIRLAQKNQFYYSGIDGIGYRRHGSGLSAASPLFHAWWMSRIFIKNVSLLESEKVTTIRVFSRLISRQVKNHLKNKARMGWLSRMS